jgi:hypothetical protein
MPADEFITPLPELVIVYANLIFQVFEIRDPTVTSAFHSGNVLFLVERCKDVCECEGVVGGGKGRA